MQLLRTRNCIDLYQFGKPDPDSIQSQNPEPDPHQIQNSGAVEAQNGAMEGIGRSQWRRGGSIGAVKGLEISGRRFASP